MRANGACLGRGSFLTDDLLFLRAGRDQQHFSQSSV